METASRDLLLVPIGLGEFPEHFPVKLARRVIDLLADSLLVDDLLLVRINLINRIALCN